MSDAQTQAEQNVDVVVVDATAQQENNTAPVDGATDTVAEEVVVDTIESVSADITACAKEIGQVALLGDMTKLAELSQKRALLGDKLLNLQNIELKPLIAQLIAIGKSGLQLHDFAVKTDAEYKRKFGHHTLDTIQVQAVLPGMKKAEKETKPRKTKAPTNFELLVKMDDKLEKLSIAADSNLYKEILTKFPNINCDRFNTLRLAGDPAFEFKVLRKGGNKNNIDDVWSMTGKQPKWIKDAYAKAKAANPALFLNGNGNKINDTEIRDKLVLKNHEIFKDTIVVLTAEERAAIKFPNIDNTLPKAK